MNINFSEVFKKLRRERELTQEQAAEAFSVSTQAVSRWENGQTSPDITLLPIIAEYFGVSIETLLGVDSEKRKALHEQYMNDFETAIKSGRVNDCIEIARAGLKEFPHSYELMNALMEALFKSGEKSAGNPDWEENREKHKQEIGSLGEKILAGCTDDDLRLRLMIRLANLYCNDFNDLEKGRKILETLPPIESCYEENIQSALRGDELLDHYGRRICSSVGCLQYYIQAMMVEGTGIDPVYTAEERIRLMKVIEDIQALVFDEGDNGLFYLTVSERYFETVIPDLISLGRLDEAVAYSEKACDYLEKYYELPEWYTYTTPLVRGSVGQTIWHTADSRSRAQIILEDMLSKECYSALNDNERFAKVKERINSLD